MKELPSKMLNEVKNLLKTAIKNTKIKAETEKEGLTEKDGSDKKEAVGKGITI